MTVERQIRELLDSGSLFEDPPGADPDVILAEMLLGERHRETRHAPTNKSRRVT